MTATARVTVIALFLGVMAHVAPASAKHVLIPKAPAPSTKAPYDYAQEHQFWSFQPVKTPAIPEATDSAAPEDAIDRFLEAGYRAKGLQADEPASRRVLIRRATYDLTGLPPTPQEVDAFLSDTSTDAYPKLIDRLLASSAYGEAWGRHWLDLARYADTSGCNSDYPIPQASKYRDYVIAAFNNDKPYDQFLREQIAGDLLPAKDVAQRNEQIIATGYLAISRRFGSHNSEFYLTIEDTIDNLGKTMLGLSVNCARCHDHKFDPIPQSDYYALYGIFSSTKYAFPGTELYQHPKDFVPLGNPQEAKALQGYETKLASLDQRLDELKTTNLRLASRLHAAEGKEDGKATASADVQKELDENTHEQRVIEAQQNTLTTHPPTVDKAYGVSEGKAADARIQHKGDPNDLGEIAPRRFLTILGGEALPPNCKQSGRLELAQWITDPANPLTARVMVNRIWQFHFGVGIVRTPSDFGHRGQAPSNPALLDYLASQFVHCGWSIKKMQRAIMLSHAYQMASSDNPANDAIDPANDLVWRQTPRRLSAEEIRDTLLTLGNSLDRTPAGPPPFPPSSEWHYTQHKPFLANYPSNHRSVYLMQQRLRKQRFLDVFDGADPNSTTPDRPISTTAIQALFMMNDPLLTEQSRKFAARLYESAGDDASRIDQAYQLAFSRHPTSEEIQIGEQYLQAITSQLKASPTSAEQLNHAAWSSYVKVLMSSDELIFVD